MRRLPELRQYYYQSSVCASYLCTVNQWYFVYYKTPVCVLTVSYNGSAKKRWNVDVGLGAGFGNTQ